MISIVVPAHNEARFLADTINTVREILQQKIPYELIVVDNASTDSTRSLAKSLSIDLVIELNQKLSISAARNRGAAAAKGDILVFMDADILVTEEWGLALINFVQQQDGGKNLVVSGHRYFLSKNPSWIERVWFDKMKVPANPSYINSGNLITTRHLFNSVEGFNEALTTGEDVDFCYRAKQAGASIEPNKNFYVYHEGYPRSIKAFFKREQWHGIGDVESWNKFFTSKVAVFSYGNFGLLMLFFVAVITSYLMLAVLLFITFIILNSLAIYKRFKISSINGYFSILLLHCIYLFARCTSIVMKQMERRR